MPTVPFRTQHNRLFKHINVHEGEDLPAGFKSPLVVNDDDLASKLGENPFGYNVVHYPQEVAQLGMGHYMIFDIIEQINPKVTRFNETGIEILGNEINSAKSKGILGDKEKNAQQRVDANTTRTGANAINSLYTRVSSSIILYTPPSLKTTFLTEYEQASTGFIGAGAAGLEAGDGVLSDSFSGTVKGLIERALRGTLATSLSVIPGAGDLQAFTTKRLGKAINPHIESVFRSVPMREFNFIYEFAPKNQKELEMVHKAVRLFKYHMMPEIASDKVYLITPSEFNITYMYMGKENTYIPKISRCVLKTMDIDQSPEGVISTFKPDDKGAFPTYQKITLNFLETEIMTKQKIVDGF